MISPRGRVKRVGRGKVAVCERCGVGKRVLGERYCLKCRFWVLNGMWRSGYLTPNPVGFSTGVILDDAEFAGECDRLSGRGRSKSKGYLRDV